MWVAPSWQIPKVPPTLQHIRCTETKKYGPNEGTGQNSRKNKNLSDKTIDNLSDAEFKTLVIRMFTELNELGSKMKEEMKTTQNEIKHDIQATNSEGKEIRTQINNLKQKEEINIELEQNEETRIPKKMRRGLGTYGTL